MTELDNETLKRRVDEMAVSQGVPGIKAAIRAALEDRDRLRAAVERFVTVEKDCCGCAEAKKLRAVLEGRDD